MHYLYYLDMLGAAVFAISGILVAGKNRMDPFGVFVMGLAPVISGGTIRDIILNHGPIFWVKDPTDIIVTIIACIGCLLFIKNPKKINNNIVLILDAIGLALFVGIGVNHAIDAKVNSLVCIMMGVLTGVGGGIIRDVLARQQPVIFREEVYATACIFGAIIHIVCYRYFDLSLSMAMLLGMIVTLVIRLCAIKWKLRLPAYNLDEE